MADSGITPIGVRHTRARSVVWFYFDKLPNEPQVARCKTCGVKIKNISSTSNLFKHLKVKHPAAFREADSQRTTTTTTTSTDQTPEPKPKKSTPQSALKGKSVVWYYFDKTLTDPQVIKCKVCGITRNISSSSYVLFRHLREKHPATYKEAINQQETEMDLYLALKAKSGKPVPTIEELRSQKPKYLIESELFPPTKSEETSMQNNTAGTATAVSKRITGQDKIRQGMIRSLICMITMDFQPPSIVNNKGFRELMRMLEPRFELPTEQMITESILPELAEETKQKMRQDVAVSSYFVLTVECWVYQESQCFMTMTGHFIKDSWDMSSVVLETLDCTEEKTETNVAISFKRITDEWGITDRIIALIANTTDDVIASATLINGWEELACFGNILNRVVMNALASVAELVRIQKKTSELVTYFENNTKASDTLIAVQEEHSLPVHKLKQENVRFWTSTFAMFERMIEQYEAVNTVLCFLGEDHLCLCDDEVELIRSLIEVLRPFEAATNELCTEPYTCMSKVIPIATLLLQVTSASITTLQDPQSALKNALITQMQTHFSNVENSYKHAASTLLDPRFKRHAFMDASALELAQQRLLNELASLTQNSDTQDSSDDISTFTVNSSTKSSSSSSFWNMFDRKVTNVVVKKNSTSEAETESKKYFKEAPIDRDADPLTWWKLNEASYPHLKVLAQKYLCIPATAMPSSRMFTKEGDILSHRREHIKPEFISTMIFLNRNLV